MPEPSLEMVLSSAPAGNKKAAQGGLGETMNGRHFVVIGAMLSVSLFYRFLLRWLQGIRARQQERVLWGTEQLAELLRRRRL